MTAIILPFPADRRIAYVEKIAAEIAGYCPSASANYIADLVERHRAKLKRIGVDLAEAENDASAFARRLEGRAAFYRDQSGAA